MRHGMSVSLEQLLNKKFVPDDSNYEFVTSVGKTFAFRIILSDRDLRSEVIRSRG